MANNDREFRTRLAQLEKALRGGAPGQVLSKSSDLSYATSWVENAGGGGGGGIPDAPNDGQDYVRKSLGWVVADYFPGTWSALSGKPSTFPPSAHTHSDAGTGGVISHTVLADAGTNTHAQIDTHIANPDIHFDDAPADGEEYVRRNNGWQAPSYFSGSYNDLTDVPSFAGVALTGLYSDLVGTPWALDAVTGDIENINSGDVLVDGKLRIGGADTGGVLDVQTPSGTSAAFNMSVETVSIWSVGVNGFTGRFTWTSTNGGVKAPLRIEDTAINALLDVGISANDAVTVGGKLEVNDSVILSAYPAPAGTTEMLTVSDAGVVGKQAIPSGGGATYNAIKCRKTSGAQNCANLEIDLTWQPEFKIGPAVDLVFPAADVDIEINETGTYRITVAATINGNNRVEGILRMYVDDGGGSGYVEDATERVYNYALRDTDQNTGTTTMVTAKQFTAGDFLKFSIQANADTSASLIQNGTVLLIERVA